MPMHEVVKSILVVVFLYSEQFALPSPLHFTPLLIRRDELVQAFGASGAYFH